MFASLAACSRRGGWASARTAARACNPWDGGPVIGAADAVSGLERNKRPMQWRRGPSPQDGMSPRSALADT